MHKILCDDALSISGFMCGCEKECQGIEFLLEVHNLTVLTIGWQADVKQRGLHQEIL